jgi:hypothetical protein
LQVISTLKTARAFLPQFFARLTMRRESEPIDSLSGLSRFVSTRAAFIAQKTLYGYLKTRMGTRYPSMFEDDVFVQSINIAKMQVFAACLSDLAIFTVRRALHDAAIDSEAGDVLCRRLALHCYRRGLADNEAQAEGVEGFVPGEVQAAFERRLAFFDWQDGASGADIFAESPAALVRWAPIAPELKKFDEEIVRNSVRFAWREVRSQFEKRVDGAAVAADARQELGREPGPELESEAGGA